MTGPGGEIGQAGAGLLTRQRLEAFSDGVIAIAATLLILELAPPALGGDVWSALRQQWPACAAYAVSFLTIGILWVNHHALFAIVRRVDHTIQCLNLLLLLVVGFVPYPRRRSGGLSATGTPARRRSCTA